MNKLLVVVDLAVTDEDDRALIIFENKGLIGLEGVVDDGETMEADKDIVVGYKVGVVGTAMGELAIVFEPLQHIQLHTQTNDAENPAHSYKRMEIMI